MSETTELTMTIPAPKAEPVFSFQQSAKQQLPTLEQFAPMPLAEIEKQRNAPETLATDNNPDAENQSSTSKHKEYQVAKPKSKEEEIDAELDKLRDNLREETEKSAVKSDEASTKQKEDNKDDPFEEWMEALDKIEFTVDLKAQLKRALMILMKAIFLMIISPNEKITGKDFGLPQEPPDDTSNELEREELGSRFKSWKQVLKAVDNDKVQGTVVEIMGLALAANEQAVPLKIKEKDKEKAQKKRLKKLQGRMQRSIQKNRQPTGLSRTGA